MIVKGWGVNAFSFCWVCKHPASLKQPTECRESCCCYDDMKRNETYLWPESEIWEAAVTRSQKSLPDEGWEL